MTIYMAETRALIGGGRGVNIHIFAFLLKSIVFKFISKETSREEHKYMNIHPPPPPELTL